MWTYEQQSLTRQRLNASGFLGKQAAASRRGVPPSIRLAFSTATARHRVLRPVDCCRSHAFIRCVRPIATTLISSSVMVAFVSVGVFRACFCERVFVCVFRLTTGFDICFSHDQHDFL